MQALIPIEVIEKRIYLIRGQKVMFDADLAELYEVETGALNRAVKRNADRFPEDFMFSLSAAEHDSLRCQIGILNTRRGGHRKYLPYVFSEQGIAMLSSVLRSKRAVQVNISIMRAFVKLREMISSHKDLARKLEGLEKKYDMQFKVVFDAIRQLMATPEPRQKKIGFIVKERSAVYRTRKKAAK